MIKKYQNIAYLVGGIAVIVVLSLLLRAPAKAPTEEASPTPSVSAAPAAPIRSTPKTPSSYGEAVQQYAGRRIQFDITCQAVPNTLSVKSGTGIMLDNRSGDARTVVVAGTQYRLAGYGWRIIAPTAKTLPATLMLDCGAARNVGTITLQK